jgi:hypothetical protein
MAGKSKVYEKFIARKEANGNSNIRFIMISSRERFLTHSKRRSEGK